MAEQTRPRRAGRPPTALITSSGISEAALSIVRAEGYSSLTMARLARALGVSPSALYNHVSGKDDIMLLLEDELMGRIRIDDLHKMPWDDAVSAWARRYVGVFSAHTPIIPIIAVLPVSKAPRALAVYEAISAVLMKAGVPARHVLPAVVALESFLFGASYDVAAPETIFALTEDDAAAAPQFSEAVTASQPSGDGYQASPAFEWGLSALIAGIDSLRSEPGCP